MTTRKEMYKRGKTDEQLRETLTPYLTNANDPYFDVFLATACFSLPKENLERIVTTHENIRESLGIMKSATICEVGKGAYSRAFRLFGKDYLAVTEPHDPTYPDAPSPEAYEGTVTVEKAIDLCYFQRHSLAGKEFDITVSNSLLGNPNVTHLIAGRLPRKHRKRDGESLALNSIRNMLGVFSNITKKRGISVHRCDRPLLEKVYDEGYLRLIGFSTEALLDPQVEGRFIEDEIIVVLRKTHCPNDGLYQVHVGASGILLVEKGKCNIKTQNR